MSLRSDVAHVCYLFVRPSRMYLNNNTKNTHRLHCICITPQQFGVLSFAWNWKHASELMSLIQLMYSMR